MVPHAGHPVARVRMLRGRNAIASCLLMLLTAFATPAGAQSADTYPNKPVRIFVPYGPGGVGDLTMRLLAQRLSDRTGQQFVVENRPGAGGALSARGALDSPADGYAMAVTGNGQAISMTLFKARTYDVLTDFTQVSITATFEMLLAVKNDAQFKSLQDVVAFAQKSPGKLTFGTINPGSTQNLSAHLFKQITNIEATIVPYKTTPELITAILRGDVDVGFDFLAGFQGPISDKQVRIIATSGETRNPLLNDVPTAVEAGLPDYVVTSWNGLATKAGLPEPILRKLNGLVVDALADPGLRNQAARLGMDARGSTPAQMRDRMASDIVKWRNVIEKANLASQ